MAPLTCKLSGSISVAINTLLDKLNPLALVALDFRRTVPVASADRLPHPVLVLIILFLGTFSADKTLLVI